MYCQQMLYSTQQSNRLYNSIVVVFLLLNFSRIQKKFLEWVSLFPFISLTINFDYQSKIRSGNNAPARRQCCCVSDKMNSCIKHDWSVINYPFHTLESVEPQGFTLYEHVVVCHNQLLKKETNLVNCFDFLLSILEIVEEIIQANCRVSPDVDKTFLCCGCRCPCTTKTQQQSQSSWLLVIFGFSPAFLAAIYCCDRSPRSFVVIAWVLLARDCCNCSFSRTLTRSIWSIDRLIAQAPSLTVVAVRSNSRKSPRSNLLIVVFVWTSSQSNMLYISRRDRTAARSSPRSAGSCAIHLAIERRSSQLRSLWDGIGPLRHRTLRNFASALSNSRFVGRRKVSGGRKEGRQVNRIAGLMDANHIKGLMDINRIKGYYNSDLRSDVGVTVVHGWNYWRWILRRYC